uniref:ubiquitin carboxyl-terminal hydrolase CYLD-like isoform X2 n=1 Tax=Pristiophorus japonicus TaxID=55135 RepID=UPI00398F886D
MEVPEGVPRPGEALYILTKLHTWPMVARGSLLTGRERCRRAREGTLVGSGSLWLQALESGEKLLVEERNVRELDQPTFDLLEAVTDLEERLTLSANGLRLAWLFDLQIGSRVHVQITSSSEEKALGVVRYRGPVESSRTYFGIELLGAASMKGFTDGSINGKRFFCCKENGGVFVPASRLEPVEEARGTGWAEGARPRAEREAQGPALEFGSHVFFMKGDSLQFGRVRFCEAFPGQAEKGIFVGIELDNAVGNWDGCFNGQQLCTFTDREHGIYQPLDQVHLVAVAPSSDQSPNEVTFTPRGASDKEPQNKPWGAAQEGGDHLATWHPVNDDGGGTDADGDARMVPTEPLRPPALDDTYPGGETSLLKHEEGDSWLGGARSLTVLASDRYEDVSEKGGRVLALEIESMVEVNKPPLYGVIRWIGEVSAQVDPLAGLEMEEALSTGCTDGTYCGIRYFRCPPNKALFVKLKTCRPDSRFFSLQSPADPIGRCNSLDFKNYNSESVQEDTAPEQGRAAGEKMVGWRKGIQGHCNSCYLDATLFCMFAFNSVLDTLLLRPSSSDDTEVYGQTRDLLRTEIVNPLRKNGYVCATKVMALRKILEGAGSSSGFTSEEKDPEEFLNQLFQLLKTEPLLKIRSGKQEPQDCTSHQIFFQEKGSIRIPTVQQLLECSFFHSDLKFTEPRGSARSVGAWPRWSAGIAIPTLPSLPERSNSSVPPAVNRCIDILRGRATSPEGSCSRRN